MNYEELYADLSQQEKTLKDSIGTVTRLFKTAQKNTESGNLTELRKVLEQLGEAAAQLSGNTRSLQESAAGFDTHTYFVNGDFAKQFLEACKDKNLDIKGEMGIYEVFPYRVRIYGDEEHAEEVWINRKKQASVRPSAIADILKTGREKLLKAGFNTETFMKELAEAYDLTCLRDGIRNGSTVTLTKLYKTMTPMARARREYDMQAFAFDLARLYEKGAEAWVTKTGRAFYFGTSRDAKNAIRVLSSSGVETYITTIKPLSVEE